MKRFFLSQFPWNLFGSSNIFNNNMCRCSKFSSLVNFSKYRKRYFPSTQINCDNDFIYIKSEATVQKFLLNNCF